MDSATGQGYRGPAVCKIVGITYRQLDHWTRTNLIEPSVAPAHGSGSQRLYSYSDLVELKVVKSLLDGGLSLQRVRKVIEQLRELGTDLAAANLVIQGNTVTLIDTEHPVIVFDTIDLRGYDEKTLLIHYKASIQDEENI